MNKKPSAVCYRSFTSGAEAFVEAGKLILQGVECRLGKQGGYWYVAYIIIGDSYV